MDKCRVIDFGYSVAISGNSAIVGALYEDEYGGSDSLMSQTILLKSFRT